MFISLLMPLKHIDINCLETAHLTAREIDAKLLALLPTPIVAHQTGQEIEKQLFCLPNLDWIVWLLFPFFHREGGLNTRGGGAWCGHRGLAWCKLDTGWWDGHSHHKNHAVITLTQRRQQLYLFVLYIWDKYFWGPIPDHACHLKHLPVYSGC